MSGTMVLRSGVGTLDILAASISFSTEKSMLAFRRALNQGANRSAQIKFTPPDIKTFIITHEQGDATSRKFVRALLEQEVASAKAGHKGDISRSNYDFVFLGEQNFGAVPEYVLHIIPKRKVKGLLLGDVWVNAKTYEVRQIVGVPAKSLSFWIKDINITVQFGAVNGMWIFTSVDAFARVRFLGLYTLTGRDITPPSAASTAPGS